MGPKKIEWYLIRAKHDAYLCILEKSILKTVKKTVHLKYKRFGIEYGILVLKGILNVFIFT
jgi:hypothetical protein